GPRPARLPARGHRGLAAAGGPRAGVLPLPAVRGGPRRDRPLAGGVRRPRPRRGRHSRPVLVLGPRRSRGPAGLPPRLPRARRASERGTEALTSDLHPSRAEKRYTPARFVTIS